MNEQISLSDLEYARRKHKTKRDTFLCAMDALLPWDELVDMVKPYYYKRGRLGRQPKAIEIMLRMFFLQRFYGLSDKAAEDSVYDSYAMKHFMRLSFLSDCVPDSSTLNRFKKMLDKNGLTKPIVNRAKETLKLRGRRMAAGHITEASLLKKPCVKKASMKPNN